MKYISLVWIKPDININLMKEKQTLTHITSVTLIELRNDFLLNKPDLVVIQGDTTTAFSATLAAFYEKIPIAHVEAGLRTNSLYNPFPEEANRRMISKLATIHFAPTLKAQKNLENENINNHIHVTGNTGIDALFYIAEKTKNHLPKGPEWDKKQIILATIHRRENWKNWRSRLTKNL